MGTFADLMSLLMCFFVLLLSFAVMDADKFKQIAGSMKAAFGVQKQIEAESIPMGTSVVKQEFSHGTPDPTPLDQIRQQSAEDPKEAQMSQKGGGAADAESMQQMMQAMAQAQAEDKAQELREALKEEVEDGTISVDVEGAKVIIRVNEQGSFSSGGADLNEDFIPVMDTIVLALKDSTGKIVVTGHTDDIPISTERYRSNWELSAARAVNVVHALASGNLIESNRFLVEGRADTAPLNPNDSRKNRAINRRVEIVLEQDVPEAGEGAGLGDGGVEGDISESGSYDEAPSFYHREPMTVIGLNFEGAAKSTPGRGARIGGISKSFNK
jgi:chemotaxis protein MotB